MTHDSIAAAIVALQAELPTIPKSKTATVPTKSGGSFSYSYADLADITQAIAPLLAKNGLAFVAQPRATETGAYELVGRLLHVSGQRIKGALPLMGRTAQEIGSSLTYGRRYLLGCLTGVITDADDDGTLAQQTAARAQRQPPPPPPMSDNTRAWLFTLFDAKGVVERDRQLQAVMHYTGNAYASRGDITEADGRRLIDVLNQIEDGALVAKPEASAPDGPPPQIPGSPPGPPPPPPYNP